MTQTNTLNKAVPDTEFVFEYSGEGNFTKQTFSGQFKSKIPNMKTQAAIAKHKAMLNGGFEDGLDIGTRNLHHMISYLRYSLVEFPDWWKNSDMGYALYDVSIVEGVYAKVLEFEKGWYESIWGKQDEETSDDKKA